MEKVLNFSTKNITNIIVHDLEDKYRKCYMYMDVDWAVEIICDEEGIENFKYIPIKANIFIKKYLKEYKDIDKEKSQTGLERFGMSEVVERDDFDILELELTDFEIKKYDTKLEFKIYGCDFYCKDNLLSVTL